MLLYLYDESNFALLSNKLSEYTFYDIAHFLDLYDQVEKIKVLDESDYNKIAIDISDVIQDGNYFRVFTARYLRALHNMSDVVFCMRTSLQQTFEKRFPILWKEFSVDTEFSDAPSKEPIEATDIVLKDLPIYLYKNICDLNIPNDRKNAIVSIASLVDEWESFSVKYSIENVIATISTNNVEYIDITSAVKTVRIRNDLILFLEFLILKIARNSNIKYCVDAGSAEEMNSFFPFLFTNQIALEETKTTTESTTPSTINVIEIEDKVKKICDSLIGHDAFKIDFKNNILKYSVLNSMGERKILSIMICGNSGIGKTEFAKIASDTMFPEEPLIKINFGNYSTEGVLNSLIGSPLGYVGSGEGGELINKIKNSNSKIILIDEFEKATPSVYNFFYELLEDGMFTDRHGVAHNLNGYIIIFTSNMTEKQYQKHIPDSLKSRFDMVYYFTDVPIEEKKIYISNTATTLIEKLNTQFNTHLDFTSIESDFLHLQSLQNLRDIKRKIEDIVFLEFFKIYKSGDQ